MDTTLTPPGAQYGATHGKPETGDTAYATAKNIAAVEKAGIHAYMVLPKHDEGGPLFSKNEFIYDAEEDLYICPKARRYAAKIAITAC